MSVGVFLLVEVRQGGSRPLCSRLTTLDGFEVWAVFLESSINRIKVLYEVIAPLLVLVYQVHHRFMIILIFGLHKC